MFVFRTLRKNFEAWPDALLSGALLLGALIIAAIAIVPGNRLAKALVLAYIVFP